MSAVNESSFGFSGTEQAGAALPQVLLLQPGEQCHIGKERGAPTSLEVATLGQIVGRITHEFNNILTVIMGHADLAMQICDTNADDLIQIKKASERAACLARNLLAFSEPHSERSRSQNFVA